MPPSDHDTAIPPDVPGLEVVRKIGQGGMGRVYLAYQPKLDRYVCLKVLGEIKEESRVEACERFRREARLLAMISHPHVMSIFDYGTMPSTGEPYLVTEYVENGDLRKMMSGGKALPPSRCRSLLAQIGAAVAHMHEKGILHRDLKPENILTPSESLVMVADFGLAVLRSERGDLTGTHRGIGTLAYASPEQHAGGPLDARSDQYSLAAVAYEMLTGTRPVGRFRPPSAVNPALGARVDGVVMKALSREPDDRYPRLEDFLRDLDESLSVSQSAILVSLAAAGLVVVGFLLAAAIYRGQGGDESVVRSTPAEDRRIEQSRGEAEMSPEFHRLVERRAHEIWVSQGSPVGARGEAVSLTNWLEAERQVRREIEERAYGIWRSQGSPTGAAGEAVHDPNMRRAERELLDEANRPSPPADKISP